MRTGGRRLLIGLTAALPGREAEHGGVGVADTMDAEYTRRMFYGSHSLFQ